MPIPPPPLDVALGQAASHPSDTRRHGVRRLGHTLLLATLLGAGWPDLQQPARTGESAPLDAAVVVGAEHYTHLPEVPYASRDADAVTQWLLSTRGVPARQVHRLIDPTQPRLVDALQEAAGQVDAEGTLWIFWSGHAIADATSGEHRLLTRADRPGQSALSLEGLLAGLADSPAGRIIIVVDASFTGVGRDGQPVEGAVASSVPVPASPSDERVVLWLASSAGQIAGPLEPVRQGLFTWHVLGALTGWADGVFGEADGMVNLEEAQTWVQRRMVALGRDQRPTLDARAEVLAWELVPAWRELPDLDGLDAGPPPTLPDFLAAAPPDDAEDRPMTVVEAEVFFQKHLQELADERWPAAYSQARSGTMEGLGILQRFLDRFTAVTYPYGDVDIVVGASQIPEARRLLAAGGTPQQPLVDSVRVEPGRLVVGSPAGTPGAGIDETRHHVTLTRPIEVARTEVTAALWAKVMGSDPSTHEGRDHPVETISWKEAVLFCNELSQLEGYQPAYDLRGGKVVWRPDADGWRLPTEAEWVHLADPGTWPDHADTTRACRTANIADSSQGAPPAGPLGAYDCDDRYPTTSPVLAHRASARDLQGLGGNVAEWVWDAYLPFGSGSVTDPAPDRPARTRVIKGGSFRSAPGDARTQGRRTMAWDERADDVGLRVVRTVR